MAANNTTTKLTIIINGKEVEKSLNGMGKELKELNKEVRGLNEGDPNFKRKSQELAKLREEYNKLRGEVYGANNATNNFLEGLKGVGAGIAAAFTVDKLLQFGQQIYEVVDQMRELNTEVSQLTGLTGPQLEQVTSKTQSLADVFKRDTKEILLAANAYTILTGDINDSLELIKKGFQEGADVSGEMLASIKEYAPFIKEAGGSAEDLMNIIKTSTIDGVFNDKGIDAVKEFTLRVREMTPATKAAFDAIGISSDEMIKKIASGELTIMDVMNKVSKRMSELSDDSQAVGVAMADIWGGPGEDAGYKFLANLHNISDATKDLTAEQQAYVDLTEKQLEVSEKWNQIWLKFTDSGGELAQVFAEVKGVLADLVLVGIELSELMIKNNGTVDSLKQAWESYSLTLKSLKHIYDTLYKSIENVAVALGFSSKEVELFMSHVVKALNPINRLAESIQQKAIIFNALSIKIADTISTISALVSTVRELVSVMSELDLDKLMNFNPIKVFSNFKKEISQKNNPVEIINNLMPNSLSNTPEEKKTNIDLGLAAELKAQAKEAAAAQKRAAQERAREAKRLAEQMKRERESLHKELLKAEEDFQKKLRSAENADQQASLDLMKDGIDKEIAAINLGKQQKIQALSDEIVELEKLQKEFNEKAKRASLLGSKEDAAKFKALAEEQVQIIATKNSTIFSLEEKAAADSLIVYSKYRALEIQHRQKANDDLINSLKVKYNEELATITTLEEAKQVLQEQYGVENVNQFTSLNDARNQVLKEQNKKLLQEQLGALEIELQQIQNLINSDDLARESGLKVLTDEDRDKQIENLKQLGLAISEVKVAISGEDANEKSALAERDKNARKEILSGIDIFGFSADDWATAFEGLEKAGTEMEKFAAKIKIAEMALQAVSNAWGMMIQAQNAALDRQVKKYEASADKKTAALKKQLEEGYISQETYNAQIEALEEDLAARKSEIAYKQAMNSWKMQLAANVSNTALAVTAALGTWPFGPQNIAMAAIVGGIGALQTGFIMANKPQKGSYAIGGPTTGLGYTDETGHEVAGVVHANEYVVPEWMHQIPVVANMVEFMEAIRTGGGAVASNATSSYAEGGAVTPIESKSAVNDLSIVSGLIDQFNQNLQLNNQLLEHLISNGVELQMDMKAAQRLNHQLDKTKKYISQAKKS